MKATEISQYKMLYHNGGFIIFGGASKAEVLSTIARFDEKKLSWSKLGDLRMVSVF